MSRNVTVVAALLTLTAAGCCFSRRDPYCRVVPYDPCCSCICKEWHVDTCSPGMKPLFETRTIEQVPTGVAAEFFATAKRNIPVGRIKVQRVTEVDAGLLAEAISAAVGQTKTDFVVAGSPTLQGNKVYLSTNTVSNEDASLQHFVTAAIHQEAEAIDIVVQSVLKNREGAVIPAPQEIADQFADKLREALQTQAKEQ